MPFGSINRTPDSPLAIEAASFDVYIAVFCQHFEIRSSFKMIEAVSVYAPWSIGVGDLELMDSAQKNFFSSMAVL